MRDRRWTVAGAQKRRGRRTCVGADVARRSSRARRRIRRAPSSPEVQSGWSTLLRVRPQRTVTRAVPSRCARARGLPGLGARRAWRHVRAFRRGMMQRDWPPPRALRARVRVTSDGVCRWRASHYMVGRQYFSRLVTLRDNSARQTRSSEPGGLLRATLARTEVRRPLRFCTARQSSIGRAFVRSRARSRGPCGREPPGTSPSARSPSRISSEAEHGRGALAAGRRRGMPSRGGPDGSSGLLTRGEVLPPRHADGERAAG